MFKKTTDSILAVFHKAVKELEDHAQAEGAKALVVSEKITALHQEEKAHVHEAFRARGAAEKIKAVLL